MKEKITISNKKDIYSTGLLFGTVSGETVELKLVCEELDLDIEVIGNDFFSALKKIRQYLEDKCLFIMCLGSAIRVHPSGMTREMSRGIKAYKLTIGNSASLEDLVNIFDSAKEEDVGTLNEQENFFNLWIKSLK
jgi:hypothetical protein